MFYRQRSIVTTSLISVLRQYIIIKLWVSLCSYCCRNRSIIEIINLWLITLFLLLNLLFGRFYNFLIRTLTLIWQVLLIMIILSTFYGSFIILDKVFLYRTPSTLVSFFKFIFFLFRILVIRISILDGLLICWKSWVVHLFKLLLKLILIRWLGLIQSL